VGFPNRLGQRRGHFAWIQLWRFAKIMDRIERDVDNIRVSKGLSARNTHFYPNEDDLRDQEIMKRA
jgi:hypothetical protein